MKLTLKNVKATVTNIDTTAKTVNLVINGASHLNVPFEGEVGNIKLLDVIRTDAEGVVQTQAEFDAIKKAAAGKGAAFAAKY
ncbi:hypothetical protein NRE35_004238 [Salmonella enterica]|nr:hypothetical protein [Salmonella enterica subsp. enterica serovar Oslo]EJO2543872.1 hypothetical protein [Salmonella enterica]ELF5187091.1 hypothetical protein [Salmonella enterica]